MKRPFSVRPRGGVAAALLFATSLVALPARAELTHRYGFGDGAANDSVGTAHGALINGAQVAGGQLNLTNLAGGFPPSGQYVDLPNQIGRSSTLTLETWATTRSNAMWQQIVTLGTGTGGEILPGATPGQYFGTDYVAIIPRPGSGGIWGTIRQGNNEQPTSTTGAVAVANDREHHLVYTVDFPAGRSALYLDGIEVAWRLSTIDPALHDQVNNWLGRSQWFPDPFFNGSIDEFRIYNHALSAGEVAQNFAAGPDVVPEPSAVLLAVPAALLLARREECTCRTHGRRNVS